MKVTKYPQSCLIVEHNGKRILIDPGSFVAEKYKPEDIGQVDAILITHEHPDHVDVGMIRSLARTMNIDIVANVSAAKILNNLATKIVKDGETFSVAGGIQVSAHE